jgi:DNA-directed RNA polymerase specialized sigma24 family protein
LKKRNNPRQLLILVLKCCNYISNDFVEKVSPSLGIEPGELADMIDCLKKQRVKREHEIALLHEKVNNQFYRCMYFEQNLKTMLNDSAVSQRMRKRLERGRSRLVKLRERLARLRPDPSNQQIADILGISKGTVDAALHALKLHNAHYLDNRHILN